MYERQLMPSRPQVKLNVAERSGCHLHFHEHLRLRRHRRSDGSTYDSERNPQMKTAYDSYAKFQHTALYSLRYILVVALT
jgi:hypothetical protein